jgi:hypothetical protein
MKTGDMKFLVIFLAIAVALLNAGCDKPVCDCPAFPNGDTVAVSIKESATVYNCCDDRFSIAFKSVKEDSRCPDGFNCIAMNPLWEGTARISVKINALQTVELRINQTTVARSGGYTYALLMTELTPHPKSGLPTDPDSYKAQIRVSRN